MPIELIKNKFNLKELTDSFNLSFSDYVIKLTVEQNGMLMKIKGEDISMDYSIGIFEDIIDDNQESNKLNGFILHAPDNNENPTQLYNAATGIVPSSRGKKLIEKCYQTMTPYYKEKGVKSIILEVIQHNPRAIKVYENCGFKTVRLFDSFKGELNRDALKPFLYKGDDIVFEKVKNQFSNDLIDFISSPDQNKMKPSWGNTNQVIQREFQLDCNNVWIAKYIGDNEKVVGWLSINSQTQRIRQVYIDPKFRNKGIATTLVYLMSADFESSAFNIANIDQSFNNLIQFFSKRIKLDYFLSQLEMELKL